MERSDSRLKNKNRQNQAFIYEGTMFSRYIGKIQV